MHDNEVVTGTEESLSGFERIGGWIFVFAIIINIVVFFSGCEYRTAIEWHGQTGIDNTTATRMATAKKEGVK